MARAPDRPEVGTATVDTAVIEANGVGRRFAGHTALSDIDLRVGEGEIFGLLGPDGAGKTTLLQTLAAILDPSEGTCRVLGFDTVREAAAVNARIGYMSQGFTLYQRLTVREKSCLCRQDTERTAARFRRAAGAPARNVRAHTVSRTARRAAFRRHAQEAGDLYQSDPSTAAPPARRAQPWCRSDLPARALAHVARIPAGGHDDRRHHFLHGRGRPLRSPSVSRSGAPDRDRLTAGDPAAWARRRVRGRFSYAGKGSGVARQRSAGARRPVAGGAHPLPGQPGQRARARSAGEFWRLSAASMAPRPRSRTSSPFLPDQRRSMLLPQSLPHSLRHRCKRRSRGWRDRSRSKT